MEAVRDQAILLNALYPCQGSAFGWKCAAALFKVGQIRRYALCLKVAQGWDAAMPCSMVIKVAIEELISGFGVARDGM